VLHALEQLPQVSDVLLLQPTSPLRTSADIEAIVALRQRSGRESAVSLTPSAKHPAWMYSLSQDDRLESLILFDEAPCRQLLPPAYLLNGALYLASRDFLLREQSFIGDDTVGYVMPAERSVDIDTPLDWKWAELLMEQQA
jgi:CMP-N-acetylneuraminic acid synthetase